MIFSVTAAYKKTKNRFMLKHYNNVKLRKNYQIGGVGGVIVDGFEFKETREEDEGGGLVSKQIFIGGYDDCLTAMINTNEPTVVYVHHFAYNAYCNVNNNLDRDVGTDRMMNTFIKYVLGKYPNVLQIKLTDNATFDCGNIDVDLYKYYMLKYGLSYYEKKFNFVINIDENSDKVQEIHEYNKNVYKKGIRLDKDYIRDKLSKIKLLDRDKYDLASINNFVNLLNDNELCSDFLFRYKAMKNECEVFNDMLIIVFTSNMIEIGTSIVYCKIIRDGIGYVRKMTRKSGNKKFSNKKLSIKKSNRLTRKLLDKN
jgi:hypothetical protein